MGDFKKFGKRGDTFNRGPGGKPSFASRPGFNRGGGERREMFKATCAECGRPCEVPFRPSGDRPVYCKDCFAAMGPQERGNRDDRGPSRGPSQSFQRRDFTSHPSAASRGVGPRSSFAPTQGSGEDKRLDDIKIQLATVISKLDKLINIIGNAAHTTPKASSPSKSETLQETLAGIGAASTPKKESAKAKAAHKKKSNKKRK